MSVGTHWREFRFPFRARTSDQELGKINFFLWQAKGIIWINGVTMEPYDPTIIEPDGPKLRTDRWERQFFSSGAMGRMIDWHSGRVLIEPAENTSAYEVKLLHEARGLVGKHQWKITNEFYTDEGVMWDGTFFAKGKTVAICKMEYVPTKRAEEGGSYGATIKSNRVGHVGGQEMVDATVAELKRLWDKP